MELPITVSVLLTREDYIHYVAERRRQVRRGQLPLWEIAGSLIMILGLAGWFWGDRIGLMPQAAGCIVVCGLFFVLYRSLMAPVMDRMEASTVYDEKKELQLASTYRFGQDGISVQNGFMEGLLPYEAVTSFTNTRELIGLAFGREAQVVVPKKLLNQEQLSWITQTVSQYLPDHS